jgi:hypothetical protein
MGQQIVPHREVRSIAKYEEIMSLMISLSLLLNIAVLIPVCAGILMNASWAHKSYGEKTPARGILLSIYIAIALTSVLLFFLSKPEAAAALLFVQIVYKVTTPFTVGSFKNPVVISNLFIAGFHTVTLITLWRN